MADRGLSESQWLLCLTKNLRIAQNGQWLEGELVEVDDGRLVTVQPFACWRRELSIEPKTPVDDRK